MLNRAAVKLALLFVFLPWISMAATPPPPVVRSVLTTNLPNFGVPGLVLGRILAPPYIDWVAGASAGDSVLSNEYWAAWGSLSSNAITGKLDSNVWWAGWGMLGTNALTAKLDSNAWYTAWGSLSSNSITDKLDSNIWWNAWGSLSSNSITAKLDSNVWAASWGALSTNALTGKLDSNTYWAQWGSIGTNSLSDKLDSNWWWTAYGSKVLTNSGQFIASSSGNGTNTMLWGSIGVNTNSPQVAFHVVGNNSVLNLILAGTTNRNNLFAFDTNGTLTLQSNLVALGNGTNYASNTLIVTSGALSSGTNYPKSPLHVTGNNAQDYVVQFGTTNKSQLSTLDTNGNFMVAGSFISSNGLKYVVSNSFIGDLVIVTNNPQIYCVNGTNQLITLPDCTKIAVGQIIRFSSTNGYSSFVLTNATGSQTIRDGTSLSYKSSGVSSVAFFNDGAAWWIASKAKTIWPNASWSTSTNVPFAVATSNYVTFDQLEVSNGQGISLTNGYQIYIRDAGQYMLTYSVVTQVGHNNDTNRVWLQQSAQNVPRSRTDVKLTSTSEQVVMTVNYIVPVVTNLTWFALVLRSTDTGAQLVTGAAASAIMPAMPAAIVTVNKISDTFP